MNEFWLNPLRQAFYSLITFERDRNMLIKPIKCYSFRIDQKAWGIPEKTLILHSQRSDPFNKKMDDGIFEARTRYFSKVFSHIIFFLTKKVEVTTNRRPLENCRIDRAGETILITLIQSMR